jgi:subtilisin family serine protease
MSFKLVFSIILLVMLTTYVFAEAQDELDYKSDEILVRFYPKAKGLQRSISEKAQILQSEKCGEITRSYKIVPGLTHVKLPKGLSVQEALKKLNKRKDIISARPNYKIYLDSYPNDPYFPQLWGLHNTGQEHPIEGGDNDYGTEDADIDAPEAWDIFTGNQDIIVAVLDSGIDYNHSDLSDNMWINQAELIGDPNSDDDGNGYKDDIYGYDFADGDSDPNDYYYHGTHVAGTIGAVGSNNIGVSGVCWNVKLMDVKIFPNYGEESFIDKAIAGIEYAVDNGATILNNSWGGGPADSDLYDAIKAAQTAGVLFIAAAGNNVLDEDWNVVLNNDIYPHYPSSYDLDNIISVMASDHDDVRSQWNAYFESHYGLTSVDIAAPGSDILSTFPTYMTLAMSNGGLSTYYETISGTSMATPHVSGACALVWSMYPHLKASQVKQIILDSADKLDSLDGLCVTEGRLNLYQALLHAHPLLITIEDDIADPNGCVVPGDDITFTITYSNPTTTDPNDPNYIGSAVDTEISFPLPEAIDPNINHPNYALFENSYSWNIGTLNPGDSNSITFTVTVNSNAEPLGEIISKVNMSSSIGYGEAQEQTRVCCWGGDRIYVNAYATGAETGVSWADAYTDLQDALHRASQGCGNEIWVAEGIYRPTTTQNPSISFEMVDGIVLYGGFCADANSLSERDYVKYRTYLSGNVDIEGDSDTYIVVNTEPNSAISSNTLLDGFVITHSTEAGIYCNEADLIIQNCVITDNDANGINVYKASPYLFDSIITDNAAVGVYDCNESHITIEGCIISKNAGNGISCRKNAALTVKNTWIHNNGGEGIAFSDAASGSVIRNNTIVYNQGIGIGADVTTPPAVTNCIIWGNENGDISGCGATYSCFDLGYQGTGNIDDDPNFIGDAPDVYNYHLRYGSPCRDAGNGYYPEEYDIDQEPREYGPEIDMGADEIYCTDNNLSDDDVYHPLDWNTDGLVNLYEYNYFARAWLSYDPNDPAFDPNDVRYDPNLSEPNSPSFIDPSRFEDWYEWKYICNIDTDGSSAYQIDLADLELFWNNWTWKACYLSFDRWFYTFGQIDGDTDEMMESQTTASTMSFQSGITPIAVEDQLQNAQEVVEFLEKLWLEDPEIQYQIDTQQWTDFMTQIYNWKATLEAQYFSEQINSE